MYHTTIENKSNIVLQLCIIRFSTGIDVPAAHVDLLQKPWLKKY